jgi:cation diffusion facilitator CzcD-associated flavoprotein CzcO
MDRELDAVIVGAGFSGLYMLYRLRELGLSALVLERGGDVGGTWYWNRYPGARCDIESVDYSYSFSEELEQEWEWTERYATQPEILRYLEHVADRFDLRRDIRFETLVTEAHWSEEDGRWTVVTEDGSRFSSRWCVMATGNLSSIKRPDFPGLESFEGEWYHTADWPQEGVDFTGRRVAVIGTGSTGIQVIPLVARQCEQLYVFQRTANYSMPAQNRPLSAEEQQAIKAEYAARRQLSRDSEAGVPFPAPERATFDVTPEERQRIYEEGWQRGGINALSAAFTDFFTNREANDTAAEFTRQKIRSIVRDPATAEILSPRLNPIGTKRTCVDIGYFETYNRDNVELVDVRETPIVGIAPGGVRTTAAEYAVDTIVFAIGFDAMTGALMDIDIRGVEGRSLRAKWAAGPRTYLGIAIAGFPNMFVVTGPGSPSVLSNMVVSIEQHVDWIADCIDYARARELDRVEATAEAEDGWVEHVNEIADETLYPLANSWYLGANIPGKPRVFMPYVGGVGAYRRVCDEVAAQDYKGFTLTTVTKERMPA